MEQSSFRWYFDYISPFAYFQHIKLRQLQKEHPGLIIEPIPVLFAGLLKHHSHKGPAEIPAKRAMTYLYCDWYARQNDIPFSLPFAHPFNPLPLLRYTIARRCDAQVIDKLFSHVWMKSAEHPDFASLEALAEVSGFENIADLSAAPQVKQTLIDHTNTAIASGVFGVPTLEIDNTLYWGLDMTEMAMSHWLGELDVTSNESARLRNLPVAQART